MPLKRAEHAYNILMKNYTSSYMNKAQLAKHFGMSKRCVEEGLELSLLSGAKISIIRPPSPKGKGHPRYKVSDVEKAWMYESPLSPPAA